MCVSFSSRWKFLCTFRCIFYHIKNCHLLMCVVTNTHILTFFWANVLLNTHKKIDRRLNYVKFSPMLKIGHKIIFHINFLFMQDVFPTINFLRISPLCFHWGFIKIWIKFFHYSILQTAIEWKKLSEGKTF